MKKSLALVAILAATIGLAAAQQGNTAGGNTGNATSSPKTTTPNYKPAAKPRGTGADTKKPTGGESTKVVVSAGGQGHNSTRDPKGKTLIAPSAAGSGKKK